MNEMKLDSVVASFTPQWNQVVLVMKPKPSVHEFSWTVCDTRQKWTVPVLNGWLRHSCIYLAGDYSTSVFVH